MRIGIAAYSMPTSHPQDLQENKQITPFDSGSA
jgi:hypothetical protein